MKRKFLFLLEDCGYWHVAYEGLAAGMRELGVETAYWGTPHISQMNKCQVLGVSTEISRVQPTDTFTINHSKRSLEVPESVTHHTWLQDPYSSEIEAGGFVADKLWMWIPEWVDLWGGKWLPHATDYGKFYDPAIKEILDLSVVMHFPDPWPVWSQEDRIRRLTGAAYVRMVATNDFRCTKDHAADLIDWAISDTRQKATADEVSGLIAHVRSCLTRYAQRRRLADMLVDISARREWSLEIRGTGYWNEHINFVKYLGPYVEPGQALARYFQSVKINLHTNGDSGDCHGRVLECFGSGGFCLWEQHKSNPAFGFGAPFRADDSLEDTLEYWLSNDHRRKSEIQRSREIVLRDHDWKGRARQILAG